MSWSLSIPAFQNLCRSDQKLLLEESVSELVVLNVLQQTIALNADHNYPSLIWNQWLASVAEQHKLSDLIGYMRGLQLSPSEFTCLKVVLLFRPGIKHALLYKIYHTTLYIACMYTCAMHYCIQSWLLSFIASNRSCDGVIGFIIGHQCM